MIIEFADSHGRTGKVRSSAIPTPSMSLPMSFSRCAYYE